MGHVVLGICLSWIITSMDVIHPFVILQKGIQDYSNKVKIKMEMLTALQI